MTVSQLRTTRRVVTAVAVGLVVAVGIQPAASAHATFVSMSPADGSVVATAPTEVVVTFNQPIQDIGTILAVHAPSGASVTDGDPVVVDNTVTAKLVPLTETGTYDVGFRVTSTDGHPVSKRLTFSVGATSAPGAVTSPVASTSTTSSSGSTAMAWVVVLAGAVLVAGAVALLVGRRRRGDPTPVSQDEPGEDTW